jgi:hypothetical protein
MTHHVWSIRLPGKSMEREPPIVFPSEFRDSQDYDRLACVRCAVWCVVFEAAICITVAFGLWLCFR